MLDYLFHNAKVGQVNALDNWLLSNDEGTERKNAGFELMDSLIGWVSMHIFLASIVYQKIKEFHHQLFT